MRSKVQQKQASKAKISANNGVHLDGWESALNYATNRSESIWNEVAHIHTYKSMQK